MLHYGIDVFQDKRIIKGEFSQIKRVFQFSKRVFKNSQKLRC